MGRFGCAFGAAIICVATTSPAPAEDFLGAAMSERQLAYARALSEVLTRWEKGEFKLEKNALSKDFEDKFNLFLARMETDRLDQQLSPDFIKENWAKLPPVLTPERALSPGARLTLAGSVVDAADRLSAQGVPPDPAAIEKALRFPLFITLGSAQQEATQRGQEQIDATAIKRGGVWLFSLGWPFCCADE
jgi:hypothetical protein